MTPRSARQVTFNEDNLADISAEVEGPGACWPVVACV